jgi:phospholipid N-methyltransferase
MDAQIRGGNAVNGGNAHVNGNGRPAKLAGMALFAQNFFTHPRMLGSIVPSSRFLIRRLLASIDWATARTIVELGPGIGNITTVILDRLSTEGRVVALDTNEDFVRALRDSIRDPRFVISNTSAERLQDVLSQHGAGAVDHVISGIPFSTMPAAVRRAVLAQVYEALRPGGSMLIYQFSPAVRESAREFFHEIHHEFEWLNVLPAHVFCCRKPLVNGVSHTSH